MGKTQAPKKNLLTEAVLNSDWDGMRNAITRGEELNQVDHHEMTPLLYAIHRGDLKAVRILLEYGADPNFNPRTGNGAHAPLWHAEDDFGLSEIGRLLRSFGAEK